MRTKRISERFAGDNMAIFLFGGAMSEEQQVTDIDVGGPASSTTTKGTSQTLDFHSERVQERN